MSLLMTGAPLAVVHHGHGAGTATVAIQWHLIAMFAPSFATGFLLNRFGLRTVALTGCVAFFASVLFIGLGSTAANFVVGLTLLGIGWNFVNFSGVYLLTHLVAHRDQANARALNELIGILLSATASGLSGALFSTLGWNSLLVPSCVVTALLLALTLWRVRRAGDQVASEKRAA
jgi:MFS family permease